MKNKKKIAVLFITIFIVLGALYTVDEYSKENTKTETKENVNQSTAIDFKLKDFEGKEITLSSLKGKNVYLNFWATWCPPCKGELPDIEKLYEETKNSDLVILAVDINEPIFTVKAFVDSNKYNFKVLLDLDGSVAQKYNITGIPASYFIDKEGKVVYKKVGAMNMEEMREAVKSLSK